MTRPLGILLTAAVSSCSTPAPPAVPQSEAEHLPEPTRFELIHYSDVHAGSGLVLVQGASRTVLIQLDQRSRQGMSGAPGLPPGSLRDEIDRPDGGLAYVDILARGIDIDDDGLDDAIIGVSSGGNLCEFPGEYYALFPDGDGGVRVGEGFGACAVFDRFEGGNGEPLEVHFVGGPVVRLGRDGSPVDGLPNRQ